MSQEFTAVIVWTGPEVPPGKIGGFILDVLGEENIESCHVVEAGTTGYVNPIIEQARARYGPNHVNPR